MQVLITRQESFPWMRRTLSYRYGEQDISHDITRLYTLRVSFQHTPYRTPLSHTNVNAHILYNYFMHHLTIMLVPHIHLIPFTHPTSHLPHLLTLLTHIPPHPHLTLTSHLPYTLHTHPTSHPSHTSHLTPLTHTLPHTPHTHPPHNPTSHPSHTSHLTPLTHTPHPTHQGYSRSRKI